MINNVERKRLVWVWQIFRLCLVGACRWCCTMSAQCLLCVPTSYSIWASLQFFGKPKLVKSWVLPNLWSSPVWRRSTMSRIKWRYDVTKWRCIYQSEMTLWRHRVKLHLVVVCTTAEWRIQENWAKGRLHPWRPLTTNAEFAYSPIIHKKSDKEFSRCRIQRWLCLF